MSILTDPCVSMAWHSGRARIIDICSIFVYVKFAISFLSYFLKIVLANSFQRRKSFLWNNHISNEPDHL